MKYSCNATHPSLSFVLCSLVYLMPVVIPLCMFHASKYVCCPCQSIIDLNYGASRAG